MRRAELILSAFRRAARGLQRSPGFTAAVVTSLALGIGSNTAVFVLVRHALLRPLPFPDSNNLVAIGTSNREGPSWRLNDYNISAWQRSSRAAVSIGWVRDGAVATMVGAAGMERVRGATAGPNLLEVLRIRPVLGRWFTPDESLRQTPVVVLSHALWLREFGGDPGVVGRSPVRIDDRPFTVIGVLPSGGGYPADAEFWYPHPGHILAEVIARTHPGTSVADLQRELRALAPGVELGRKSGNPIEIVVVTLHDRLYGVNGPILRLLLGTVVLLLLLTCTNVANLSLARALARRRELAVCVALGASRRLLAFQVLAENSILAVAGAGTGMVVALLTTGLLVRLSPAELRDVRGAGVDAGALLFAVLAAMVVAVAVTIAPALAVARGDLRPAMGQPGALGAVGRSAARTRGLLVVAQLAIALLMLTASGLLIHSMVRLTSIDTGFDQHGLVIANLQLVGDRYQTDVRRRSLVDQLIAQVRTVPGVRSVAIGPPPLVGGRGPSFIDGYSNIYSVRDSTAPGAPRWGVWIKYVDPSYLETFRIRVRAGRGISVTDDAHAPAVALVNAAAERLLFPDGRALGRQLDGMPDATSGGRPITVIGLLPDVRQRDVTIPAYPEIWLPRLQQNDLDRNVYVSARTDGDPEALVGAVRRIVAALDRELAPRRISTMDGVIRETLAPQRYVLVALGAFAALALVLAVVGLYAVMAYLTATRTREIGVRIALGARSGQVLWMVLRSGLRLATAGVAIGLPIAYASSRTMARFLYEVEPRDAWAFLAAPTILVLSALIAAYIPALRATRVDPVTALRSD